MTVGDLIDKLKNCSFDKEICFYDYEITDDMIPLHEIGYSPYTEQYYIF